MSHFRPSRDRVGLSPDELVLATWSPAARPRYAARTPALNLLAGETVALVGSGTRSVLESLADALGRCSFVDGVVAANGGVLRVHAQQAARVGVRSLAVTGPFDGAGLAPEARALAIADLAGLGSLDLTTVVEVADVATATLFADRVAVVRDGGVVIAYPVVAPQPRRHADVATVAGRVLAALA